MAGALRRWFVRWMAPIKRQDAKFMIRHPPRAAIKGMTSPATIAWARAAADRFRDLCIPWRLSGP
ncbi:hypothetical protein CCS01_09940 [Rhodopila globiformis]|uniref:Uncharacterized protein n=1 Tax=Rhodopila globiformis TaxID=1071 RepID=A0A2S6NIZ9_RHOGL|nr:hypothetical protein CCS01_09940 [Rhodopila globiformis]